MISLKSLFAPLLLAASTFFVGCVTYSPFLHLPAEQIKKGGGEVGGSFSGLTQTGSAGAVSAGAEGFLRYGFGENLALGLRTWTDDLNWADGFALNGCSVDALISLSDSAQSVRYGLAPRFMVLFEDRTLRAQALMVNGVAWLPQLWFLKPYASVGGGVGNDLDPGADGPSFIYAGLANMGASVDLFSHLSARAEVAAVTEFDGVDGFRQWFVSPSLSVVWEF